MNIQVVVFMFFIIRKRIFICVKITPLNTITATNEHGLKDAIQWNWDNMNNIKEKVENCGLKVFVDVAAKAELPLCCGNLVQDYKSKR